jgi:hypothetical protein
MNGLIDVRFDGWVDGWIGIWMDGWMDECLDGRVIVSMGG